MLTVPSAPKSICSCEPTITEIAIRLAFAFSASVILAVVCWQQLGRSLWVDEAMLISNYPLSTVKALFSPLAYYDQAATPAYSLLASLLSGFDIGTARIASLIFISFLSVAVLLTGISGWRGTPIALLALTAFATPLIMLSELKHYGLEILGVIISIHWYLKKNPSSKLDSKDLLILVFAMLLGVSTVVTSAVALVLFTITKYNKEKKIKIRDALLVAVFIAIAIGYYFLIKNITSFQIHNYPDAYENKGILINIKSLLGNILMLASNLGVASIAIGALSLAVNFRNNYSKRLIFIGLATGLAFVFISAMGLYPVNNPRHVTWTAAFFWVIVFYGYFLGVAGNSLSKAIAFGLLILLTAGSTKNIYELWSGNHEITENNQAISFINSLPPSKIGLWIGGQPVVQYYSKLHPGLEKHSFFGSINPLSANIDHSKISSPIDNIEYQRIKSQPGGWGSMVAFRILQDYSMPAMALINEAPRGETFYIFASHFNINADIGFAKSRVVALHQSLEKAQCDYEVFKKFKGAIIYKTFCQELK